MTTFDVAAFQPPETAGGLYSSALFTDSSSGRQISGLEKLVQRFVLELLTDKGSMPFAPARGCSFLSKLLHGMLSEADVLSAFNIAMLTVTSNLQAEELTDDPADEKFSSASLDQITIGNHRVGLTVSVRNRTGDFGKFVFPVSLNVRSQELIGVID